MKMQKHWYLGFLGIVGFLKIDAFLGYFTDGGHWLDLTGPLWFLWFLEFIPQNAKESGNSDDK